MIQLWHFSLAPGCSVQSDNNQMVGRIFKITPKMSQQACHSSHVHTRSAASASAAASAGMLHPARILRMFPDLQTRESVRHPIIIHMFHLTFSMQSHPEAHPESAYRCRISSGAARYFVLVYGPLQHPWRGWPILQVNSIPPVPRRRPTSPETFKCLLTD